MSGQWWESDLIVGPFANITEANAWAAANPSSLFQGLLATINGTQYSYGGAGAGWAACGGGVAASASTYCILQDVGANLLPAARRDGYYVSDTGVETAHVAYSISDYVAVVPGERYQFCASDYALTARGGWYDASKVWIAKVGTVDGLLITVPAGASYLCINTEPAFTVKKFLYKYTLPQLHSTFRSISVIGTSITYGLKSSRPWWKLFSDRVSIPDVSMGNFGIGSSTVASPGSNPMSLRLSALTEADIVGLEGTVNDWSNNIPLGAIADTATTTYYGALNTCAKYMKAKFPQSVLFFASDPDGNKAIQNSLSLYHGDYATAMKAVANRWGIIYVAGFESVALDPWPRLNAPDNTHPGDIGSYMFGDVLFKSIFG